MASSDRETLKVLPRDEYGSRTTRRLRREGLVPGVVYTGGKEARSFKVAARDAQIILDAGHALFDLEIDGSGSVPVVVKEQQLHPVRGDLQHLDLQEVRLDVKIFAEVPIELEGVDDAPGIKASGVLEHVTHEVTVEALPTDIPDRLVLDVSAMEIGDTLSLAALEAPEGVEFVAEDFEEITLANLSPPRIESEPSAEVEAEPGVVGEEAPAAAAEGEGDAGGDSGEE